ncbi:MAG: ribonuclease [Clostridium sp.]|nr:ribonuclease [Clostridium sp.]
MLMMFVVNIMPASFVQASDFINNNLEGISKLEQNISIREASKSITGFEEVANYIKKYKKLPDNFITKKQAMSLGWVASKGNLAEVAPGKSIGGDVFSNREKKLPTKKGRTWREADIDYVSGFRNDKRLLYSSDGLFYKTVDHYKTFTKMNV